MREFAGNLLKDKRFWICLALAGAAAVWLSTQADLTCNSPRKRMQMEIFKANSCFEFWASRYQTTIQTVISALIGGAGLFFVLKQLKEISHQNDMTRRTLETTIYNTERERRRAKARAITAINEYAQITARLAVQCSRVMGQPVPENIPDLTENDIEQTNRNLADIYEVLDDNQTTSAWRVAHKEFDSLVMYVMARKGGLTPQQAIEVGGAGYEGPASDDEAIGRAINLSVALAKVRDLSRI